MLSLAIIGDIHLSFAAADVTYFNHAPYDLILIVGDLASFNPRKGYRLAERIARLKKPALAIPGNHDTVNLYQLLAEMKGHRRMAAILGMGQASRTRRLQSALNGVKLGGYTTHPFHIHGIDFDVITARPFSMGGPSLNFRRYLRRSYGVDSVEQSASLLSKLVDCAPSDRLIFLAHNGPHGLGSGRSDIWGCDFLADEVDFGDVDLRLAVEYARSRHKRVIAVVAGHMHHQLRGGGTRQWLVEQDGTLYVNAARVPRIFDQSGEQVHHHVRLAFDAEKAEATQQFVPASLLRTKMG